MARAAVNDRQIAKDAQAIRHGEAIGERGTVERVVHLHIAGASAGAKLGVDKLSAALGVDINCLLSDDIPDERAKNIEALLSGKPEWVKLAAEKLVGLLVESIESGVK